MNTRLIAIHKRLADENNRENAQFIKSEYAKNSDKLYEAIIQEINEGNFTTAVAGLKTMYLIHNDEIYRTAYTLLEDPKKLVDEMQRRGLPRNSVYFDAFRYSTFDPLTMRTDNNISLP